MYDARIGRWISPDPYGEFHSPYLAMANNPASVTDPDGGCTTKGGRPCVFSVLGGKATDAGGNIWSSDGGSNLSLETVQQLSAVDVGTAFNKPFSLGNWIKKHVYINANASIDFGTQVGFNIKALGAKGSLNYKEDVNPLIKLGIGYDRGFDFVAVPGGPQWESQQKDEWNINLLAGIGKSYTGDRGIFTLGQVEAETSNWVIISITEEYHTYGTHKGLVKNRKFGWSFGGDFSALLGVNADLSFGLQFKTKNN